VEPETINHFIGGRPVKSSYAKTFGVTDPACGKEYARVAVGLGADTNNAVLAARAAFETGPWAGIPAPEKASVLSRIADAIDARAGDVADAEALGTGLPVTQAREQTARASGHFRLAAELITARDEDTSFSSAQPRYVLRRPVGVAGIITPWRAPFLAQARVLAPALAAGCTVVLQPDVWAPLSAALLPEITAEAGLPGGVLNIVHGGGDWRGDGTSARTDTLDALVAHPDVPLLSFTGETAVAQQVMTGAATHGKLLSADLIGNSPCVIFADADLDQAADSAVFGAFSLNGGRRTATWRILAERPVCNAVVTRLAERADHIRVGSPANPSTELGPLVHAEQYDRVMSRVRLGIREGARLAAGGRRPVGLTEGNYLSATVLADVTPEMRIFAEVISGPVACVTPFDTEEEAVTLANAANSTATAPAAYIWTADLQRAHRLAPAIDSTAIWVNSHNTQDLRTPSGKGKDQDSIGFYTQSRTICIAADDTPVPRFGA
jgi:5-carboxymethyl-2-hydroxymuconic-semialdehyde dehydrogenase